MSVEPADNRTPDAEEKDKRFIPFFPNYLLDEVIVWYIALAALIVLASLFPVGLEEQADPLETPAHIKPEWYFLFLYQILKLLPRTAGVLLPGLGVVLLLLIPFLDHKPSRRPRDRKVLIVLVMLIIAAVVFLTVWGWLS